MATQYRYLFTDLLTNQVLAELPMTNVNFTQQLNSAGTFTGELLLSGVQSYQLNVLNATIPARCCVYVDRNGVLEWGGIIWQRNYNSTTQRLKITAREFLSYFEHRLITSTQAFTAVDQLQIVETLVAQALATPYGNVPMLYNQDANSTGISGILSTRTYYGYELKTVMQAITDLATSAQGFDFEISVYYDGTGSLQKSFNTYYPKTGDTYSATNQNALVFELGGNISSYDYTEDGSKAVNSVYVIGAGSSDAQLISTAQDTTKFANGWGLLEETASYTDVTDTTLLANLASAQIFAASSPPITLKIVAPPYVDPVYGTYEIGDDVRVRIKDPFFPQGLDNSYRIVALNVQPGETGPEQITLTLTFGSYIGEP